MLPLSLDILAAAVALVALGAAAPAMIRTLASSILCGQLQRFAASVAVAVVTTTVVIATAAVVVPLTSHSAALHGYYHSRGRGWCG